MTKQIGRAGKDFFTRLWRSLQDFAEVAELSQTELLERRVAQIERQLRQPEEPKARPSIGASND
ncbi:hypothetical protein [Sphingomonas sp. LaA6.9]|uniref:hypothetical protein n=1 Tax=Sphingomonas sp. LaA6.9 TaxID=2919914 RepID=UPI001F4FC6C0|nr:hypothetical protein [Sphingomonas sp. LaA6.9]MCJ8157942.1 hypothetical protein [Sphingomonas sp. LaA6.9]